MCLFVHVVKNTVWVLHIVWLLQEICRVLSFDSCGKDMLLYFDAILILTLSVGGAVLHGSRSQRRMEFPGHWSHARSHNQNRREGREEAKTLRTLLFQQRQGGLLRAHGLMKATGSGIRAKAIVVWNNGTLAKHIQQILSNVTFSSIMELCTVFRALKMSQIWQTLLFYSMSSKINTQVYRFLKEVLTCIHVPALARQTCACLHFNFSAFAFVYLRLTCHHPITSLPYTK